MRVRVLSHPDHGVSIGRWFTRRDPESARALLAAESKEWQMASALRGYVNRVLE
ncbi:MAG: hypothetical protein ACR2MA_08080 [Egibacteraceae bacterium]